MVPRNDVGGWKPVGDRPKLDSHSRWVLAAFAQIDRRMQRHTGRADDCGSAPGGGAPASQSDRRLESEPRNVGRNERMEDLHKF